VTVYDLELVGAAAGAVHFRATVSAGTYLRALARDLGERLGVGAHLTALRREAIGTLRVEDAVRLGELSPADVLPPRRALGHLPARELDETELAAVSHGRAVPAAADVAGNIALVHGEELVAVARVEDGWLRPSVVLEAPA
jgi:tRNA pseudouridine55 synthase